MSPTTPSKLERLDIPGKGGLWRIFQGLSDAAGRRKEFERLIANDRHDEPDTIPKLRTLIDLGLWSDFVDEDGVSKGTPDKNENRSITKRFGQAISDLFGRASLIDALRTPKQEAEHMFSSLKWDRSSGKRGVKQGINVDIVHLMLEAGLDPNIVTDDMYNHRLMAHQAYHGHNDQAMKLFKGGANPRLQAWPKESVAHILADRGSLNDIETLRQMVEAGFDINDPGEVVFPDYATRSDPPGRSAYGRSTPPISMAIANGNLAVVRKMMDMGATLEWEGESVFQVFAQGAEERSSRETRRFMDAMLELGAPLDEPDTLGRTPLWYCVPRHPEKALWLIEHGARVDLEILDYDMRLVPQPGDFPQTLIEHLIIQGAELDKWKAVVDQIQERFPDCWDQPCSTKAVEGARTVADLAMHRGEAWGAMASAGLLMKRVDPQPDNPAPKSRPRF